MTLEIFPGTPAENPGLPTFPSSDTQKRLFMYAVRLNPGATELSDRDWYDYREDANVCGYCKCILGTRIQCLDGFMEWDDENHEWKVGEE